jgi:hypothetical protein
MNLIGKRKEMARKLKREEKLARKAEACAGKKDRDR